MITAGVIILFMQATVILAAGVAFDSTIASAIIAGIFVIVNQLLTFFLQGQMNDRERNRTILRPKKKSRHPPAAHNRMLGASSTPSGTERDGGTGDQGEQESGGD